MRFPTDFRWGVATSAYQIEGAARDDGRGPSIWDTFAHTPGKVVHGHTGDVACDHYHRLEADLDLIRSLGVNSYRFSVAWSRVQPLGYGAWNSQGLDFYERLVDGLLQRGIAPFLTLYHWDLPQGLQDRHAGWAGRDTAYRFADYAQRIGSLLGDRVASIATHNEPWCSATLGYDQGIFAPGVRDVPTMLRVSHHLLLSHGLALQALRADGVKAPLGIVLNQSPATAATDSAADIARAEREYARFVRWYMEPIFCQTYPQGPGLGLPDNIAEGDMRTIAQPLDFLGVNYYTRIWASTRTPPLPAPCLDGVSDMGWENYAQGLHELLLRIHRDYRLPPIYITENGFAEADTLVHGRIHDPGRQAYLRSHLQALHRAMQDGVDVRGFFYWSLMDNFEWASGYDKRFGLVHVDYASQKRTLKDSALRYREFIASQR